MAHPQKRILDGITDYWKQSSYYELFHLRAFTQPDTLRRYLRLQPVVHVLAADPELLRALSADDVRGIVVVALSVAQETEVIGESFSFIVENPYQPLPQLFQSFIGYCQSKYEVGERRHDRTCRIVGITSTTGGSGKSTVAFHLAAIATQSGLRPFIFNTDLIHEYGLFLHGASERMEGRSGLSQLFYYLKKAEEGSASVSFPLEPYLIHVPALGARMFHPHQLMEEWRWIDERIMRLLLRVVQDSGQFDLIIVEGAYYQPPFEAIWEMADRVMWLLLDDMAHIQKAELLLQRWGMAEEAAIRHRSKRMRIVLNRYMGEMQNQWNHRAAGITGYLPYIPAWKQIHRFEHWLQSTVFQSALIEWSGRELGLSSIGLIGSESP